MKSDIKLIVQILDEVKLIVTYNVTLLGMITVLFYGLVCQSVDLD